MDVILVFFQYYATIDSGPMETQTIRWLTKEDIEDRSKDIGYSGDAGMAGLAGMVGSGQSVGGVVSETVGSTREVILSHSLTFLHISWINHCQLR